MISWIFTITHSQRRWFQSRPKRPRRWLLPSSSSLLTSSIMSKFVLWLVSSLGSVFLVRLPPPSRHLLHTIFLSPRRHRSLHSPHTKHLALYSFPFIAGSSAILLPRALWDVVALYCFRCSRTIWSHIEHIPPLVFLWLRDIALSLNRSASNSPPSTSTEEAAASRSETFRDSGSDFWPRGWVTVRYRSATNKVLLQTHAQSFF